MNDLFEDFEPGRAGEVAVGVLIGLAAFKIIKGILKVCLE